MSYLKKAWDWLKAGGWKWILLALVVLATGGLAWKLLSRGSATVAKEKEAAAREEGKAEVFAVVADAAGEAAKERRQEADVAAKVAVTKEAEVAVISQRVTEREKEAEKQAASTGGMNADDIVSKLTEGNKG